MPITILRLLIVFPFLTLTGCKHKYEESFLAGTWKLDNVNNTTSDVILEIATFYQSDTLYLATIVNGTPQNQMVGKYKLSKQNTLLTTYYPPNLSFRFEVLKLDRNRLELRQVGKNAIQKYTRMK
jgi:hypothetical protein